MVFTIRNLCVWGGYSAEEQNTRPFKSPHTQPVFIYPKGGSGTGASGLALTCADEAGVSTVDQVVVVGQDERTALLDLQAVLVARYLPQTRLLDGGEILSTEPGLVGHLKKRRRREDDINRCRFMILLKTGGSY